MKKLLLTFLVGATLVSCNPEDTENPVISITSPTNGQHLDRGTTFTVTGTITDNEELSQFKIDMHHGDGHEHKSTAAEFDFELIQDIEGAEHTLSVDIAIPTDAEEGEYHLIIEATDEAGNEADFVEIDLDIHAD